MDVKSSGAVSPQTFNTLPMAKVQDDHRQASGGKTDTAPTKDAVHLGEAASLKSVGTATSIESLHNRLNQFVIGAQKSSEGLSKATVELGRLRATIVKNFPPFPKDNGERQEALMSYISIAKEIRQMTVPPPPPPIYEKVRSEWDAAFAPDGTIKPEALPQLNTASSATDISSARTTLAKTGEQIASLNKGISQALGQ